MSNITENWRYLFKDSRARVYLVWGILVPIGFLATQYHQQENINWLWVLISLVGLGYMCMVMPLKLRKMQLIMLSWLVPITIGLVVSFLAFRIDGWGQLIGYLGSYWLLVMAVGFFCNGLVDPPSLWYWLATGLNLIAALACYKLILFAQYQFLVAAAVVFVSMMGLWLFRSFDL